MATRTGSIDRNEEITSLSTYVHLLQTTLVYSYDCILHKCWPISILAGREYISFRKNRALVDNFFKLCMVLCMDMTFSKTTAHKSGETPSGCYPQNPRWPPLETEKAISRLISTLQPSVIPVFLYFWGWGIRFWNHYGVFGIYCSPDRLKWRILTNWILTAL